MKTTFNKEKLKIIDNDVVMWDGNQIGFFEDDNTILMGLTNEDFENGEFSLKDQKEIKDNKEQILSYLKSLGYKLNEN